MQALRENGVEKFSPEGQKFDPNLHDALFELPDPSKEPGTVGAVTKVRISFCCLCASVHMNKEGRDVAEVDAMCRRDTC